MYDYKEFEEGYTSRTHKCHQCMHSDLPGVKTPQGTHGQLEDIADGYKCDCCDSFYTYDEVHGLLES